MKNRIDKTYLRALCAGALLLSACTKDDTTGLPEYSDTQISLQAQLPELGIEQQPGSESRAVADPTQPMDLFFARADEAGLGTGAFGDYGTSALPATRAAGAVIAPLTFTTPQYYISNNRKSRFTGWGPAATYTGGAGAVVSWTLDGSQDVLTAVARDGSGKAPLRNFVFEHRLSRLQFEVVASSTGAVGTWGTISAVNVLSQPSTCTYTLSTGAVALSGSATFGVKNFTSGTLTTTAVAKGEPMMVAPAATNVSLALQVVSSTRGTVTVPVPARTYEAGKAYKLTLSFKGTQVSATVVPWNNITTDDTFGKLKIGSPINGGVVYWIDPADPNTYKVVSVAQAPTTLRWAAKQTYVIGAGAQSDTDAKGNAEAIKKAYDKKLAGVAITESTFEAAFPAAAYCYNYQGKDGADAKGSWYLPAKTDLQYLWCAFNGKAPAAWGSPGFSPISADATAQAAFNKYLTDAGGANIINAFFWSSAESSSDNGHAWGVSFVNSHTTDGPKTDANYVRCIKNPIPQPAVGDYYFTDGSFSSKIVSGKTVNGVIYYVNAADPKKFKVMALDENSTTLRWAASNNYTIGSGAHSLTDGRGNAAAIKAAFDSKMAGIAITESTFDAAFPAAAYCYNYKGKADTDALGSWYLPAKNDLQYLWCAYNDVAPISWESGTNAAAPTVAAKQTEWNNRIKAGGAAGIKGGYYLSSTEASNIASYVWNVLLMNGSTTSNYKTTNAYIVRCVRDI